MIEKPGAHGLPGRPGRHSHFVPAAGCAAAGDASAAITASTQTSATNERRSEPFFMCDLVGTPVGMYISVGVIVLILVILLLIGVLR